MPSEPSYRGSRVGEVPKGNPSPKLARDGLVAVAEWERRHGSFSDAEVAEARARVADEVGGPLPSP